MGRPSLGSRPVARRLLWAALGLAPLTIALRFLVEPSPTTLFVLASVALVPLAWLIGEATDHAALHTGPGIGGFLNATFGNAPELIIALLAINKGLEEVVRGSLTGSVVGNLLLVLGFSLIAAPVKEIDRRSALIWTGLVVLATALILVVAIPDWTGDVTEHTLQVLSIPVSIVLLVVYIGSTWWQLRRHRAMYADLEAGEEAWPLRRSLLVLGLATVATAFVAEILVGSLENFAEKLHVSDFFVAAVIVAIVGNAAEHGSAVVLAHRGRVKLATEIALSSSAQVAVFLIPAVSLLSWLIEPLSLGFRQVELAVMAGAALLTGAILWQGRSGKWRGVVLVVAYAAAAGIFYKAGGR
jgi:Ca2+:H+ antiporter